MILRKPYAFLIKNFRKINIILLVLVSFMLWKDLSLYSFVKNYISTGIYNTVLDSITNYANILSFFSLIIIAIISTIMIYLLKYKDKPYVAYAFILITDLITLVLFIYLRYYFTMTVTTEFNLQSALIARDLTFISTLPYYVIIFILIIRSIGLDLKKFGFSEDKEFIIDEEDREEIEVEVSFNKDRLIRQIKNKIRMAKYTFLEHKFSISIITGFIIVLIGYNVYHYVFVENRIYKPNESFNIDGYSISVNNTYITNRDYTGNLVDNKMYYLILESTITNNRNYSVEFDPSNFFLYIDNDYYIPTDRFNNQFQDMGTMYEKGKVIKGHTTKKLIFVYEINKPNDKSNFLISYQNTDISKNAKRIRINVSDISEFIKKGSSSLNEDISIPLNLDKKWDFSLTQLQLVDSINYRYGECNTSGTCPIYENTLNASSGKTILNFKFILDDGQKNDFISFLKKYGKVVYTIDGVQKTQSIKYPLSSYRGDYAYIEVNDEIKNASKIELYFTVRSYQYIYTLKGE